MECTMERVEFTFYDVPKDSRPAVKKALMALPYVMSAENEMVFWVEVSVDIAAAHAEFADEINWLTALDRVRNEMVKIVENIINPSTGGKELSND